MNEDFLAYVWKFQYFDKTGLQTTAGEPLAVLRTGMQNFNAGPDFLDASVKVGELTWAGAPGEAIAFKEAFSDLRYKIEKCQLYPSKSIVTIG